MGVSDPASRTGLDIQLSCCMYQHAVERRGRIYRPKKWLAGIQASGCLRKDATGNGNDAKLFREVREHFLHLRWEMMERCEILEIMGSIRKLLS